jgi:PAS domain S-box-containing protein
MARTMKEAFWNKLADRLDKLDPDSVQAQFVRLSAERGLMETIFHALREGILVLDAAGRVLFANRAVCRMFGLDEKKTSGRLLSKLVRNLDGREFVRAGRSADWTAASREIEISYPEHRFLSVYLAPLSEAGGDGVVMILRDTTRERDHAAEMVESERLNAVLMLAAGVAHEIGNPLDTLSIHMQLMDRKLRKLPPDSAAPLKQLVDVARGEIDRLDRILSQFLKAIRPSLPKFARESLPELARETLDSLSAEIRDRGIQLDFDEPDSLPTGWVDAGQVRQALFNVMHNAVQAMGEGGILRVSFASSDRLVGVAVEDTGPGIAANRMGDLFEPFQTTKANGNGMGLMIVQRILRDHGGTIMVDTQPGGTRVQLNFQRDDQRVRLLAAPDAPPSGNTAPSPEDAP